MTNPIKTLTNSCGTTTNMFKTPAEKMSLFVRSMDHCIPMYNPHLDSGTLIATKVNGRTMTVAHGIPQAHIRASAPAGYVVEIRKKEHKTEVVPALVCTRGDRQRHTPSRTCETK
jgi:hypothetical protein